MLIQWHVTERCNLRCSHCYQERPPADPTPEQLLTVLDRVEEFAARLRRAAATFVPIHLTLTGGEPFLHPAFMMLLERIVDRKRRWSFAVLTNGTLLDAATADALRPLRPAFVQVSIEGSEAVHDRIRGPGSFRLACNALERLAARRIPAYVSFTAHRGNVADFPAVAALARSLKVTRLWADRLIPLGRGASSADGLLSPDETLAFFKAMHAERMRAPGSGTEIAMHRALQFLVGGGEPYRCTAGETLLTILPDGTLCPCRRLPIPAGNVLDHPLETLYAESPVLRSLRDPLNSPEACAPCFYSRVCRGGLRCLAHAVHDTPFAADPGCWLAPRFPDAHPPSPAPAMPCPAGGDGISTLTVPP